MIDVLRDVRPAAARCEREVVYALSKSSDVSGLEAHKETAMHSDERVRADTHVKIVVAEGKVTLEDLHAALEQAVRTMVPRGGCNCGLTGFDISFLRGDPQLAQLNKIPNVQAGLIVHG